MFRTTIQRGILLLFAACCCTSQAQDFSTYFTDRTLRLDYSLVGNAQQQTIALDELYSLPNWWGKRIHLAETPVEGNAQVKVFSTTGELIYKQSFSTLFQEWLSYPEAQTVNRSFEQVLLVPYPKDSVRIQVELYNNRREVMTQLSHIIHPSDILIHPIGETGVQPYRIIQQPKDSLHCVNIAFVAEGYQEHEMKTFLADVDTALVALFAHEPFKSNRDAFRIVAVESPSQDTGVSEPGNHLWRHTAVGAQFDTFYMPRYLTTLHMKQLHNTLAGIPYDHIIVLANTSHYGGGGILNFYNLSMTHHRLYKQVVVHEFGHSFAGLADEYAYENEQIPMYPHEVEPWEPNITTLVNFYSKWSDLIGQDPEAGLYEGAGYNTEGIYRPYFDCRMRTNENPEFCPVCRQAIQHVIDFYTKP